MAHAASPRAVHSMPLHCQAAKAAVYLGASCPSGPRLGPVKSVWVLAITLVACVAKGEE